MASKKPGLSKVNNLCFTKWREDSYLKQAAIVYWSKTGNTEKVAYAIKESLEEAGIKVIIKRL